MYEIHTLKRSITKTVFLSAVICVAPLWAANNKQLTVAATVQEEKAEIILIFIKNIEHITNNKNDSS